MSLNLFIGSDGEGNIPADWGGGGYLPSGRWGWNTFPGLGSSYPLSEVGTPPPSLGVGNPTPSKVDNPPVPPEDRGAQQKVLATRRTVCVHAGGLSCLQYVSQNNTVICKFLESEQTFFCILLPLIS